MIFLPGYHHNITINKLENWNDYCVGSSLKGFYVPYKFFSEYDKKYSNACLNKDARNIAFEKKRQIQKKFFNLYPDRGG